MERDAYLNRGVPYGSVLSGSKQRRGCRPVRHSLGEGGGDEAVESGSPVPPPPDVVGYVPWLRSGFWLRLVCALAGSLGVVELKAELVAEWRFEAPPEPGATGDGRGLEAGRGVVLVPPTAGLGPGRFGQALWLADAPAWRRPPPVLQVGGDGRRLARVTNPTDTRLNLGADDWTLEGWLWLEAGAAAEGVIYEIGSGPPGEGELVTRFSVTPREEAFVLAGIVRMAPGETAPVGRHIEFNDPAGPPHGVARLEEVTLVAGTPLPRGRWFHVALVHAAGEGTLRLFVDGRAAGTAPARLAALPRGPAAYLAIGCDGRRARVFAGAIDELRVSDHAGYTRDFTPAAPNPPPANP